MLSLVHTDIFLFFLVNTIGENGFISIKKLYLCREMAITPFFILIIELKNKKI